MAWRVHLFPAQCWWDSLTTSPFQATVLTVPLPQALDKMEKEWSAILFNVLPYKETDTYILKSPDEASQLLDDHIVMTQSMSFSPYKKPFEQRINSWETKLKLTQVGLRPFILPSEGALPTKWHLPYFSIAPVPLSPWLSDKPPSGRGCQDGCGHPWMRSGS